MKKKLVILSALSIFASSSIFAQQPTFLATDHTNETKLCMKIATGTKSQLRNTVKQQYGDHLKQRMAFKGLKCNDMSVYSWANKHGSPEVKKYVSRFNRSTPKGTVTIKDIDQ